MEKTVKFKIKSRRRAGTRHCRVLCVCDNPKRDGKPNVENTGFAQQDGIGNRNG